MSANTRWMSVPAWRGDDRGEADSSRGVRVGFLDVPAGLQDGEDGGLAAAAWVSLAHPSRWAGPLLDDDSFEGAWLEGTQTACFRVRGATSRVAAPRLGSPDEARRWLADGWASLCAGADAASSGAADAGNALAA